MATLALSETWEISLSNRIICLAKDLLVVKWFENEKIISQAVRIGKWCGQNGDIVLRNNIDLTVLIYFEY